MTPERLLFLLTTVAVIVGFWLFNTHALPTTIGEDSLQLRRQNTELTRENDDLRGQVANLRSMLANGPYPVPEPLIEFVQKDLGLDFASAPPMVKMVGPDELRNATERTLNLIYGPSGIAQNEKVWRTLGLLAADENFLADWLTLVVYGEAGFYDLSEDTIFLPQESDLTDTRTQAVLVRLLAQQRIARLRPEKTWPSLDAYRAWQAATLGAAYDCEKRYFKRRSLSVGNDKNSPAAQRDALLLELSPAFQNLANLPNLEGRERANEAYLESRAAFAEFLKNPPTSTRELLFPKAAPIAEVPNTEKSNYYQSIGSFGLRLILDPAIGLEASSEIAKHWCSDQIEDKGDTINITIHLNDSPAAQKLTAALTEIYEKQLVSPISSVSEISSPIPFSEENRQYRIVTLELKVP